MPTVNLKSLSDRQLLSRLNDLVRHERRTTIDVLSHLNEVERRKLHLKHGYSSLFEYCTEGLRYSASGAGRRIQTARCIRRYPQICRMLCDGEVSMSTVSKVASVLLSRDEPALLERIRGKSQREVEDIVAEYRPNAVLRDRVKSVCIRVPASDGNGAGDMPSPLAAESRRANHTLACAYSRSGSESSRTRRASDANEISDADQVSDANGVNDAGGANQARGVDSVDETSSLGGRQKTSMQHKYLIQFAVGPEFMKKFKQARTLLSFGLPAGATMESVFDAVLDEFIDRHSPEKRRERRRTRRKSADVQSGAVKPSASNEDSGRKEPSRKARAIAIATRDEVFARDGHRCSYVAPSGRRCSATSHLQIDHIVPVARGGDGALPNLRLLCAHHNRMEAERLLGEDAMRRYARRE